MASSIIDLIIRARDQASSVFGRIGAAMFGLGKNANVASDGAGSFVNAITGGILQANLFTAALGQVQNGIGFMMGKFEEAKGIQTKLVATAGSFAAVSGVSFAESTKFVGDFNLEIAKIAGALPGATKDYNAVANTILDKLVPAYKDMNGILDKEGLHTGLVDITKQMTLLGIQTGTNSNSTAMFAGRFLSGMESLRGLRILEFGTNNPAFLEEVKLALKAQGKSEKDFQKLTVKQRAELLKTVSAKFITKEVLDAASNTVDGLTEAIKSNLFDPTSGIFGLMRDLSPAEGNQSVMTAIASGIKSLTNQEGTGFFDQLGNLFAALGVPKIDPMLVLYNGINTLTSWITNISSVVATTSDQINAGGGGLTGLNQLMKQLASSSYLNTDFIYPKFQFLFKNIAAFLQPIFDKYLNISNIQSLINSAASGLSNIFGLIAAKMPGLIGGVVSFLMPLAEKYLNPAALSMGVQKLFDGFGGVVNGFFAMTASLSGSLLGENGAQISAVAAGAGYLIFKFLGDLISQFGMFVIHLPWADIFITIGNVSIAAFAALASFTAGALLAGYENYKQNMIPLLGSLVSAIWDGTVMLVQGLGISLAESFNQIISNFSLIVAEFDKAAGTSIGDFFDWITQGIMGMWEGLKAAFNSALEGAKKVYQAIADPVGSATNAVTSVGSNVVNSVNNIVSDPLGAIGNAGTSVFNTIGGLLNPPAYNGHIPTAANGLLGALATESRNMPSGASPVIANSSEFVLTPAQMSRMMQGSASVGASSASPGVFAPVFNITGSNASEIAAQVMQILESQFQEFQQGVLA